MQRLWEGDRDSVSTKYAAWMKPAWYTAGEPKPQEGHAPNKEPVFSLSSVLLLLVCVKSAQSCPTLRDPMAVARRLLCPWDSSGKNTGVGCPALLQGIFPTPGSNPHPLTSPALVGRFFLPLAPPGKPFSCSEWSKNGKDFQVHSQLANRLIFIFQMSIIIE